MSIIEWVFSGVFVGLAIVFIMYTRWADEEIKRLHREQESEAKYRKDSASALSERIYALREEFKEFTTAAGYYPVSVPAALIWKKKENQND